MVGARVQVDARWVCTRRQQELATLSGRSASAIQRTEANDDVIRNVDSLKLIGALDAAGFELIAEGDVSRGAGAACG